MSHEPLEPKRYPRSDYWTTDPVFARMVEAEIERLDQEFELWVERNNDEQDAE